MEEPVRVTIAPNEVAADVVCTFLRAEGIRCNHRVTNIGAGGWDGVPNAGGAREVLVDPADLDAAREALASAELGRVLGLSARAPARAGDGRGERCRRDARYVAGFSWWPPNCLRIADSTLFANSPSSRDEKRE